MGNGTYSPDFFTRFFRRLQIGCHKHPLNRQYWADVYAKRDPHEEYLISAGCEDIEKDWKWGNIRLILKIVSPPFLAAGAVVGITEAVRFFT